MPVTFTETGLRASLISALKDKGYIHPTPIQVQAIPPILKGKDILGCAQTGTGKTAAFALPIIQNLVQSKDHANQNDRVIRALILTPTRELAIQIEDNIRLYSKNTAVSHAVIFGGVKQGKQVESLREGANILVATPGRLLDLIGQGIVSLKEIEIFVLDEADRMLDMGFIHDIKKIIKLLPRRRQSLFFSATMPDNIVALSKDILTHPQKIEVTPESTAAETVQQEVMYTNKSLKKDLLVHVLKGRNINQVLVFTRTKHGADRVARDLKKKNISSAVIHGDKQQNHRQKVLGQFKDGKIRVLVATDIAARGIDIDKLAYVINYDVPNEPESYVHRIGRSGRAGEEGIAISFAEPEENVYIKDIEKLIGQKLKVITDHPYPQTDKPMTEAEKKEWQKEKERKKQEYFANRRNKKQGSGKGKQRSQNQLSAKNNDEHQSKSKENRKTNKKGRNKRNNNAEVTPRSSSKDTAYSTKAMKQTENYRNRLQWPLE